MAQEDELQEAMATVKWFVIALFGINRERGRVELCGTGTLIKVNSPWWN